jgi:hypothetical protein
LPLSSSFVILSTLTTFYFRICEDHLHAVREELSNLRKHISALSTKEMDVLEESMKSLSEESQTFMKKQLRDETRSLKDDVEKISMENKALKAQLEEVLRILHLQCPRE